MIKHIAQLTLSCLIFLTFPASAGPGDGPIVPWPSLISPETIVPHTLTGEWVAYANDSIWYINIDCDRLYSKLASITINSNAIRNHMAKGWLEAQDNILLGTVSVDSTHIYGVMLFADQHNLFLRVATGQNRYFDLTLHRKHKSYK